MDDVRTRDRAPEIARIIIEHPLTLLDGFGEAVCAFADMTWAEFKRGVEIALELARADGRIDAEGEEIRHG